MNITAAIIHRIRKQAGTPASFVGSSECLDITDPNVVFLINQLEESYTRKTNFTYGVFGEEYSTFKEQFNLYIKDQTEEQFWKFSRRAGQALKEIIASASNAKGGYIIFAHYKLKNSFLGVFLVRDTKGLAIRKPADSKSFSPRKRIHIDLEKIAMVGRINLTKLRAKEGNYLSLSKGKEHVSDFFLNWIGMANLISNAEDTKSLYELIKKVDLPDGEESLSELLWKVSNHIQANDYEANVRELSEEFYGDRDYLLRQSENLEIPLSPTFKGHKATLKRFIKIKAVASDIELSFPRSLFEDRVVAFAPNDRNTIMINSAALAEEIRNELNNSSDNGV